MRFVGPDFPRAHARLFDVHFTQFKVRAEAGGIGQLGEGIGEATGAHVVDGENGVVGALLPAGVDDFLAAAFDFRVAALYGSEVQISGVGAGRHGRRGATAKADQHARPAQLNQQGAGAELDLEGLLGLNAAEAAGDHDRLVIATHFILHALLEGTEITGQVGTAEFVVEGRRTQRAFDHDVEGRGNALGLAVVFLPSLLEAGDLEVGHRETGQAGLGLGAAAGGTFIANLAAGAGGGPREGRDGGRVVVGFDLGEDVGQLFAVLPGTSGVRVELVDRCTFNHRGVVGIGDNGAFRVGLVGVADHAEEGFLFRATVDDPVGIEDLVAAVLGVRLGEHHQLDVGRVAPDAGEVVHQIVDFVVRQGQAQLAVGHHQRVTTAGKDVHGGQGLRGVVLEQGMGSVGVIEHRLGHAVVDRRQDGFAVAGIEAAAQIEAEGGAALDTNDLVEAALVGDVGGLGGPGRDRAQARRHHQQAAGRRSAFRVGTQQVHQAGQLVGGQRSGDFREIPVLDSQALQTGQDCLDRVGQPGKTGTGEGGRTAQLEDFGHGRDGRRGWQNPGRTRKGLRIIPEHKPCSDHPLQVDGPASRPACNPAVPLSLDV